VQKAEAEKTIKETAPVAAAKPQKKKLLSLSKQAAEKEASVAVKGKGGEL